LAGSVAVAGFYAHDPGQRPHCHRHNRDHAKKDEDCAHGTIGVAHDQNPIRASATQAAAETGNPIAPIAIKTSQRLIHFLSIETSE
jgi:hypothetical protein